ncbi:ADP-ribosylation/crystallin J1 [Nocardia cyriacigeorgica]|uniref:ADP-ribosylation/crystallin J1 n=1 Tax=Nocardia cyriacigeorgica TaxID=135487 RepID=A0A5R8NV67_9NOCA|nr:ADP-ribosylation/crystallin J1 [Nocardia cyriacigeorgica]TLF79620.1 ADP-ribosylation/crystallin J1 [Nocardia cyriacigeorgica]
MNSKPNPRTTTLWRPTGPEELELVAGSGWREWPPRLPDQPIFYPVLTEEYAILIARDWNVAASGAGYVTRFSVESEFLARYPVQQVGGREILEYWIPAEDLPEFNRHIVGKIRVVHRFPPDAVIPAASE